MFKTCIDCNLTKPLTDFYPAGGQRVGHQVRCKACDKIKAAARYVAQRERILTRTATYATANPSIARKAQAAYRVRHLEKVRERDRLQRVKHPARLKARDAKFSSENRDKIAAKSARRRALKLRATPAWAEPGALRAFYLTADGLNMLTGEWHHVDHIVPLRSKIVCGLHCPANLQVLPGATNSSKGNRYWPDMPA